MRADVEARVEGQHTAPHLDVRREDGHDLRQEVLQLLPHRNHVFAPSSVIERVHEPMVSEAPLGLQPPGFVGRIRVLIGALQWVLLHVLQDPPNPTEAVAAPF